MNIPPPDILRLLNTLYATINAAERRPILFTLEILFHIGTLLYFIRCSSLCLSTRQCIESARGHGPLNNHVIFYHQYTGMIESRLSTPDHMILLAGNCTSVFVMSVMHV